MLKNYLLVAWRNLWRKKSFSFINITGLSIGMSAAILILLWIQSELQFDQSYPNKDRIYEVWNRFTRDGSIGSWSTTPKVMGPAIQADYPDVERIVRVNPGYPVLFSIDDKRLTAKGNAVDSSFFQVFGFQLVKGDPVTALNEVYSIALTESLAASIFGKENPMGKTIKLDNSDNFKVTAIIKDYPRNTRFDFQYLVSWAYIRMKGYDDDYWGNNSIATYVMLKPTATLASFTPKIKNLRQKYDKGDPNIETFLYPITRTYLHGRFENNKETGGRIEIVRLFAIIAGFILLVACINFMNLSTARSEKRAKEVGIRKVVGARRGSLIGQFLGESVLLAFIAGVLALFIVELTLPGFNKLVDKDLVMQLGDIRFWLAGICFVLLTGVLAGSYPALYLSSFRPVSVMKGTFKAVNALITPRKLLVIGQFTFAIVLIIATIIVRQQLQKAQGRQAGYSRDNLVYHFMEGDVEKNYAIIKNELVASGYVESVTKTSSPITESWSNTWGIGWQGKDPNDKRVINRFCADDAITKTIGLKLVAGRDLDLKRFPTDSNGALLNEAAVKTIGFKDPIGQTIQDLGQDFQIVGVVKDFILSSPYRPIDPMVIVGAKGFFNVLHIKLSVKKPTAETMQFVESVFKKYNPEYPFNYRFADEEYARKFNNEKRTGTLATIFAVLTIVISCLGLFGLASYMAENRIKEIGVRKVLGASVGTITRLLSMDFLKLVTISFMIAAPLGYWAMHNWLKDFPYRVSIQWWVFALAGLGALLIALVTVSFQAVKAAMVNPVKSLRSE